MGMGEAKVVAGFGVNGGEVVEVGGAVDCGFGGDSGLEGFAAGGAEGVEDGGGALGTSGRGRTVPSAA
jgi:hypothetical protein